MNTSGRDQSEMGESDPLISSSSTTRPSKTSLITSFFCFIGFLLCFVLAILLLVQYSRGGLPLWELFLSVDNQDHISMVTDTSGPPYWHDPYWQD